MANKINELALGYAASILGAAGMLLLGLLGNLGLYAGAVSLMGQWHMFFSLSPIGIIAGMVEAGILSFILAYVLAYLYNRFA